MANFRRQQRVAGEIQRRASQFIREELKDPRLGFLTITAVDISRDLGHATLFVSVLGDETEQQQTMNALGSARGLIKRDIGDWLQLRSVPEITFRLDHSIERGTRILEMIKDLPSESEHDGGA